MIAADLVDPYGEAGTPPPRTLVRFYLWCLKGVFPLVLAGCLVSMMAGALEVSTALLLGLVIDSALATDSSLVFSENVVLLAASAVFFLLVRPVFFGASSAFSHRS